jgi:hypothetical protein
MPTSNFTHNNIEHHAKPAKTEPKEPAETPSALNTQTETQLFTPKKISPHTY